MNLKLFDEENYIENLGELVSDKIDNDHIRLGYKTGYIRGLYDAKNAKLPRPKDIKCRREDEASYGSFWACVFPASSGLAYYKYGYKDGYIDGYKFYLNYVKGFFDAHLETRGTSR